MDEMLIRAAKVALGLVVISALAAFAWDRYLVLYPVEACHWLHESDLEALRRAVLEVEEYRSTHGHLPGYDSVPRDTQMPNFVSPAHVLTLYEDGTYEVFAVNDGSSVTEDETIAIYPMTFDGPTIKYSERTDKYTCSL